MNNEADPFDPKLNLSLVERMDLVSWQEDQRRKTTQVQLAAQHEIERQKTARKRWESFAWVACSIVVACLAFGIAWIIWQSNKGPGGNEEVDRQRKLDCLQAGGSYVPMDSAENKTFMCLIGVKEAR